MTTTETHVVTGYHDGSACPRVVAMEAQERHGLVDTLLNDRVADPRVHSRMYLHVSDGPMFNKNAGTRERSRTWLRLGFHEGFGGVFFYDDTTPQGADWAWVALNPVPGTRPPSVFFHQEAGTVFPPQAIMPIDSLRAIALEWVDTGRRPTVVEWMPVNALDWVVDDAGGVTVLSLT